MAFKTRPRAFPILGPTAEVILNLSEFWLDFLVAPPPPPEWPFVPSKCVGLAGHHFCGGYFPYRAVNFAEADAATHPAGGEVVILLVGGTAVQFVPRHMF